jgi:hypothetical protein
MIAFNSDEERLNFGAFRNALSSSVERFASLMGMNMGINVIAL